MSMWHGSYYNFLSFNENGVIVVEKEDFSRDKIEEYKQEYLEIVDNLINNRKDTTIIVDHPGHRDIKLIRENSVADSYFINPSESNSRLLQEMFRPHPSILTYNIYVLFRKKYFSRTEITPEDEILLYNENGIIKQKIEAVGPMSSMPVHVEEDLNTKELEEFEKTYTIELGDYLAGESYKSVVIATNLPYVDDSTLTTELRKEKCKTREFVSDKIGELLGDTSIDNFSDLKKKIYKPDTIITPNRSLAESMEVGKLYYGFHLPEIIGEEGSIVETATYNPRTSVVMLTSVAGSKYTWKKSHDLLKVTTLEHQGVPTFTPPTKYDTVPNEFNLDPVNDKDFFRRDIIHFDNSHSVKLYKKTVFNDTVGAYQLDEDMHSKLYQFYNYPNETKQVLDKYLPKYKIQVTDTLTVPYSDFKFGAIMYPFTEVFKKTTIQLDYPLLFTDLKQDSDGSWSCEVRYYQEHLKDTGPWRVKVEVTKENDGTVQRVHVVITDPSFYNLPLVKKEGISEFRPTTKFIGDARDKFISVKMSGRHILEAVDTDTYVPGLVRSEENIYHYYKIDSNFCYSDFHSSYDKMYRFEDYIALVHNGASFLGTSVIYSVDRIINKAGFDLNIPYIEASEESSWVSFFDYKRLEKDDIFISEFNFTEDKKIVFQDTLVRKDKMLDMLILKKYKPEWFEKLLNGDKKLMDAFINNDSPFPSSHLLLSTKEDRRDVSRFFASHYYENSNRKIMSNEEYLAKKRDNSFTKEELFLMENCGYVGE